MEFSLCFFVVIMVCVRFVKARGPCLWVSVTESKQAQTENRWRICRQRSLPLDRAPMSTLVYFFVIVMNISWFSRHTTRNTMSPGCAFWSSRVICVTLVTG
jgi:hypothetical protein